MISKIRHANGNFQAVKQDIEFVAIHDAARPCLVDPWIDSVFSAAEKSGAAILATPITGTLKRSQNGKLIAETVDRSQLWQAFTPQMFRLGMLLDALQAAVSAEVLVTDESPAIERQGYHPTLVEGHTDNLKITRAEDLSLAALYLTHQLSD